MRGDQGGQRIFFAAEAGQQCGLFFSRQTTPDLDHFLGGADQNAGLQCFIKRRSDVVGHGAGLTVQAVWKAHVSAFHTVCTAGVSVFAFSLAAASGFFRLGLLGAGLLRGRLLRFVQAWEGEIRYLVHRGRSSQGLFFQSQVIPRSQKALAGYSTANDKKIFISTHG